jgi:Cu(I)/Ag(I) efflux system membrane fusion protein
MANAEDLPGIRPPVNELTPALIKAVQAFGIAPGNPVHKTHCPMALDNQGGDWLQTGTDVRNPYYGAAMLACGVVEARIDDAGSADEETTHAHEGSHREGS